MNKFIKRSVWSLVLSFACLSPVQAVEILWTLDNAVFDDGGTITGSFIYDADTDIYSSVSVTTTAGTEFGGFSYTDAHIDTAGSTTLDLESPDWLTAVDGSALNLVFFNPLTNAGGTINLDLFGFTVESWCINVPDCSGAGDRGVREAISGSVIGTAVVPLPPAVWLFGSGLLGLLGISRRKKAA
jgi:hypothetical protein